MTKPTDWPGIGTGFVKIVKDWAQCQLVCQSMTVEFALVRPPSRLGTKPHRGLVPSLSAGMAHVNGLKLALDWHGLALDLLGLAQIGQLTNFPFFVKN